MKKFNLILLLFFASACGVRGKPLPPEKPPMIGRGHPSFQKATENVVIPKSKKKSDSNENKDEDP